MPNKTKQQAKEGRKPQSPKITVERLPSEDLVTIYANSVQVRPGTFDFRISFGVSSEDDKDDNIIRMSEKAMIYMSPQHAKAFLHILAANMKRYESEFGEINLRPKSNQEYPTHVESE